MARAIGVSRESVRMILSEAGLKTHREVEGHLITEQAKVKRLELCKRLRKRFAADRHRAILFSDEKWFDIEKAHNYQNDRMWSNGKVALEERMIYRRKNPKKAVLWAGVTSIGKTPLLFVPEGVKVQGSQYCEILENEVVTWARKHSGE
ncbi:hypothetical protein Y032_0098g3126 [Ancylostoma ceylanicum]|uniref:Transposase n=1 Tax=Ancylostoma ceylanicum TaxID=53326 RepID=A0A016TJA8_9BILA|nr:hypothetical protein Y032_0098g3126 [Ancylostoma ceylanicum]